MYNTQKILQLIFLFNLYGLMCPCTVLSAPSQGDYISDIQSEYDNQGETQEIVIVKPETPNQSLSDVIFDKKLTKEFQSRYEYEFGRTAFEQNADIPLRYEEYITADNQLISAQEDIQRRQVFGEYIVKRLSEHHIDEYVKSNPSTRPMFELKERISHLNMSVKKGYRLKMHYSYSGNYMDFKLDNPYDIKTKLTLEMNPGGLGPSHIYETQLSLEYPLEKTVSLASDYKFDDGILKLVAKKSLSPTTSASLSGSTFTKSEGVIEFSEVLKADQVLINKLMSLSNVKVTTNAKTQKVVGNGEKVTALEYENRATQEVKSLPLDGVFVQIGLIPNSELVRGLVETTAFGEIIVDGKCRTNQPGIYAAGDVTTTPYKQIIISMGEGAKAALAAFEDQMLR